MSDVEIRRNEIIELLSIIDCNVIRKRFWNHLWMTCLGYGICKNKNIKNALHLEKIFSILQNRNTILPESIH